MVIKLTAPTLALALAVVATSSPGVAQANTTRASAARERAIRECSIALRNMLNIFGGTGISRLTARAWHDMASQNSAFPHRSEPISGAQKRYLKETSPS